MRRALASLSLSRALCALWLLSGNAASRAAASQTTRLGLDTLGDSSFFIMSEKNVMPLVCNTCTNLVNITHTGTTGATALAAASDYLSHASRSRHSPHAVPFDSTPNSSSCTMHDGVQVSAVNKAQRSHEATRGVQIATHRPYVPQCHAWSRKTGADGPSGDVVQWAATRLIEQICVYVAGWPPEPEILTRRQLRSRRAANRATRADIRHRRRTVASTIAVATCVLLPLALGSAVIAVATVLAVASTLAMALTLARIVALALHIGYILAVRIASPVATVAWTPYLTLKLYSLRLLDIALRFAPEFKWYYHALDLIANTSYDATMAVLQLDSSALLSRRVAVRSLWSVTGRQTSPLTHVSPTAHGRAGHFIVNLRAVLGWLGPTKGLFEQKVT